MNILRTALNVGSLGLVAVIGWCLVRGVLGLLNPQSLYAPAPIVAPAAVVTTASTSRVYDFSTDPFSLADAESPVLNLAVDAPETSLNLTLKGSTTESSVVLGMPDGQQKNIRIDEEIMGGVTLKAIGKDFVTLDVNGEIQRLTLERVKMESQGSAAVIGRAAVIAPVGMPSRDAIESLFSKVEIVPEFDSVGDGLKRRGFKIKPKAGVDLSTFGLQSDDILTRIGPVLLDQNRTNIAELRDLISTGAAQDFEVLRDGAAVTIRIGQ